jgi:hypothetical protein
MIAMFYDLFEVIIIYQPPLAREAPDLLRPH